MSTLPRQLAAMAVGEERILPLARPLKGDWRDQARLHLQDVSAQWKSRPVDGGLKVTRVR